MLSIIDVAKIDNKDLIINEELYFSDEMELSEDDITKYQEIEKISQQKIYDNGIEY